MNPYFRSEVVSIGVDVAEMLEGGVAIFFAEPCPDELAEVSIVHRVMDSDPQRDPAPGDVLRVGASTVTLDAVGAIAGENLRSLGHMVVYVNPEEGQDPLPGAVLATGALTVPTVGETIEIRSGGR